MSARVSRFAQGAWRCQGRGCGIGVRSCTIVVGDFLRSCVDWNGSMVFWGWYGGAREVAEEDLKFYVLAS